MISPNLAGSETPKEENNAFLYEGKLWRTSREDIAQGVCAISSTTEQFWATLAFGLCEAFLNEILGM